MGAIAGPAGQGQGRGVVVNLEQNPSVRPVMNRFLPALLRQGTLWSIRCDCEQGQIGAVEEERWMTDPTDHRHRSMSECVCLCETFPSASMDHSVSESHSVQ